ncbi:hypothetical protein AXA65_06835 [Chryseobacterium sp. FP211-J200]|nr:hypothetical protein AXA65_06835 [Chryseobacterium sp. FP211-J200]
MFFSSSSESINLTVIFKIIKQFGLIISIPTTILFFMIDFLIQRIKTKWILYLTRCIVFVVLMYLVNLFFSLFLISSALLDNPLINK